MNYSTQYIKYVCLLTSLLMLNGCDNAGNTTEFPVYIVEVSGESFRVQITDSALAEEADSLLLNGIPKIVHGFIKAGDGGFNAPYAWHLDPERITFPDLTIELCDGRPGPIEDDLDYWINTVGIYCPWGAQITGKE